jgi:hypothetical protein
VPRMRPPDRIPSSKFWNWRLQKKIALSGGSVSRQSVSGKRRARSTSRPRPDDERMFGEGSGPKMRAGLASNHAAPE